MIRGEIRDSKKNTKYDQITKTKNQKPNNKQITMTKIQNSKQLAFDLIGDLKFGIYLAQF